MPSLLVYYGYYTIIRRINLSFLRRAHKFVQPLDTFFAA